MPLIREDNGLGNISFAPLQGLETLPQCARISDHAAKFRGGLGFCHGLEMAKGTGVGRLLAPADLDEKSR